MRFSSGATKLSVIPGCPYYAGVRKAGFHCTLTKKRNTLIRKAISFPKFVTNVYALLAWQQPSGLTANLCQ